MLTPATNLISSPGRIQSGLRVTDALPAIDRRIGVSTGCTGVSVAFHQLPGARLPWRVVAPDSRVHLPAPHHHRVCVGTQLRYADGGDQPLVASDRGDHRPRRAGRRRAPPIAARLNSSPGASYFKSSATLATPAFAQASSVS